MRIAILSTGSPQYDEPPRLGGIQKQIRGLASAYDDLGHEVSIIARGGETRSSANGDHLMPIRVRNRQEILARLVFSRRAAKILRELKPDLLEMHERFSAFFPSRLSLRKVFFARNYDAMRYYAPYSHSRRVVNWGFFPLKSWVEEECMRRSEMVFALNNRDVKYLRSRGFGRVVLTQNAVDTDLYRPGPDQGFILFAGRLDPVKGVDVLLEAFEAVARETDLDLHIAGDGALRSHVDQWRRNSGLKSRTENLGWLRTSELAKEYSSCSFLVLPSFFETFGSVVIEAMASGKPVIASRIPGPAEVVEPSRTGFLFSPGSVKELVDCCLSLAADENLRRGMGATARRVAENRYSYMGVGSSRLHAYRDILAGTGP